MLAAMIRIISHGLSNEKKSSLSFYRIVCFFFLSSFISPFLLCDCSGCGLFSSYECLFFLFWLHARNKDINVSYIGDEILCKLLDKYKGHGF